MGCDMSIGDKPGFVHRHKQFENNFKSNGPTVADRPKITASPLLIPGLDDDLKQLLWDIIKGDDVRQFAYVMESQDIDVKCEIQAKNSFWSFAHFCARWDSYQCLDMVLKWIFQEENQNYLQFVNLQTAEGYTALELAIIWNATNCFHLLLTLGGVDLTIKDIKNFDVFSIAASYKRTDMIPILQAIRQSGTTLVPVNTKMLSESIQLDEMLGQEQQPTQRVQQFVPQKLDRDSDRQKQILEFKRKQEEIIKKNQAQLQKLSDQHSQINQQYMMQNQNLQQQQQQFQQIKQNQSQNNIYQQPNNNTIIALPHPQDQLTPEQLQLQQQQKMNEIELQKRQQEYLEKQKQLQYQKDLELQKLMEQQKIAEQQKLLEAQKQQQLQQKDQEQKKQDDDMQKKILEQRQLLKKTLEEKKNNISNKTSEPVVNNINLSTATTSSVCPPELQALYNDALQKKVNFVDTTFPPVLKTIGSGDKLDADMKNCVWLRPKDIFQGEYHLFDGIDPDDIKQGSLGVCYYLSTIASLAEKQNRIRRLFPFHNKQLGFYVVKLYIHGVPTNIVVDDFMPCMKGTNEPIFTKPNGNQLWVMILEKAWVKNFGSYLNAQAMSPDAMMQDVDGAPSKGVWIEDVEKQFTNLLQYDKQDYIAVLTSLSENTPEGIVSGHAYSLLDVYNINGIRLLKIRNPWGSFEWNGEYGHNSPKWTPDLKKKVNYKDVEDGIFYMTPNELKLGFNYYSIGMIKQNYIYSHLQFSTNNIEDSYFTFSLSKKSVINVRLVQMNDRFLNDKSYSYSPVIFQLGKIISADNVQFISEGNQNTVFGDKSVHGHDTQYQELEAGNYFVRIRIFWTNPSKYNKATLVAYAPESITFTKIAPDSGLKYLESMLIDVNKEQQLGQIVSGLGYAQQWIKSCYVFTCQNSSNKNYELTVTFNPNQLKNCQTSLRKKDNKTIVIPVNSKSTKVGTLDKVILKDACQIGSFNFQAKQIK